MTDKYAVIGNPISHSKSPQIHKMFAEQTGQDISYEAVLSPRDGFAATIERLRDEGYKGCSVTVPFKFDAFQLATQLTKRAQAAQAVNTLKFEGDIILGDNTDGAGLINDLIKNLRFHFQGKQVLLAGAGGAAYGVAKPLLQAACKHLAISNRTIKKAEELAASLKGEFVNVDVYYFSPDNRAFDLVVNATSSGLRDELPMLPPNLFSQGALAYDMMYGRETPFMKFAREQGAHVADGLGMLVEQAAEAFYLWRGVRPDTAPVIAALRQS